MSSLRSLILAAAAGLGLATGPLLAAAPALAASGHPAGGSGRAAGSPAGAAASLTVRTVPAIPGARVSLDGYQYLTGRNGQVVIPTTSGLHQIRIQPPRDNRGGSTVHFSRWIDGIALADRPVTLSPQQNTEVAGFVVSHPISVRFAGSHGKPVPPAMVTKVTIANSLGQRFTFSPAHPPASLAVNRIVRDLSGLVPLAIRYTVREVIIDGSNVVYGGSQNFYVHNGKTWTVRLLLFPMRVEVRDALFGFPIGNSVKLMLPNGSVRTLMLGAGHAVTIRRLPRATYQLAAHGPGIGLTSPSSLSKPQVAKLLLLSWVDIAAVAAFLLLFVVGLPVLGGRIVRRRGGWRLPAWHAAPPGHSRAARPRGAEATESGPAPEREPAAASRAAKRIAGLAAAVALARDKALASGRQRPADQSKRTEAGDELVAAAGRAEPGNRPEAATAVLLAVDDDVPGGARFRWRGRGGRHPRHPRRP